MTNNNAQNAKTKRIAVEDTVLTYPIKYSEVEYWYLIQAIKHNLRLIVKKYGSGYRDLRGSQHYSYSSGAVNPKLVRNSELGTPSSEINKLIHKGYLVIDLEKGEMDGYHALKVHPKVAKYILTEPTLGQSVTGVATYENPKGYIFRVKGVRQATKEEINKVLNAKNRESKVIPKVWVNDVLSAMSDLGLNETYVVAYSGEHTKYREVNVICSAKNKSVFLFGDATLEVPIVPKELVKYEKQEKVIRISIPEYSTGVFGAFKRELITSTDLIERVTILHNKCKQNKVKLSGITQLNKILKDRSVMSTWNLYCLEDLYAWEELGKLSDKVVNQGIKEGLSSNDPDLKKLVDLGEEYKRKKGESVEHRKLTELIPTLLNLESMEIDSSVKTLRIF